MTDDELLRMACACKAHLSADDYTIVGMAACMHAERFATLLSAYGGVTVTEREFAGIVLRVAKQVSAGGAA